MIIFSSIVLLISNAVNNRRDSYIFNSRSTLLMLIFAILLCYINLYNEFSKDDIYLFGGLLCINNYKIIFSKLLIIITFIIISLSSFHPKKLNNTNKGKLEKIFNKLISKREVKMIIEYPLIILFCITGGIFLMFSSDIISVFLAIELQSYGLYLLCSIYRNSENSVNAGLTYFLLGALSSCIILLGQSLIYLNTGSTNLENVYIIKNIYDTIFYNTELLYNSNIYYLNSIQYSLIIFSVGLLFKISSAPFHFWSPDVYDAIPTIATTFVAIIAKISILIFLLQIIINTSNDFLQVSWVNNILLSSILSLIIGSVLGIVQYRIKRLYAYSTISHLGFILLALSINSYDSIQAFLFYIIQYSISNLNAFIILIGMGYSLYLYSWKEKTISYRIIKDFNYSPIQLISQLKGYFFINPILSISFMITLFSFIGVPPIIGFFAKQMVLISAIDNGYIFITLIAIITSVISAVYYLVIIKCMFFENIIYNNKNNLNLTLNSIISVTISMLTLLLILYMFYIDVIYYIYL